MTILLWTVVVALAAIALVYLLMHLHSSTKTAALRASGRVPLAVPVRMRVGGKILEALSADISRGGMCLQASIDGAAGQPVELEFTLPRNPPPPGDSKMLVYAVVRWKKPETFGVLFDLHDANRGAILEWIAAQTAASVKD